MADFFPISKIRKQKYWVIALILSTDCEKSKNISSGDTEKSIETVTMTKSMFRWRWRRRWQKNIFSVTVTVTVIKKYFSGDGDGDTKIF